MKTETLNTTESREKLFWERVNYSAGLKFAKKLIEKTLIDDDILNKTILDIGCGIGMYSFIFGQKGAKDVLGIDNSERSIKTAKDTLEKEGFRNVQFLNADIRNYDFQNSRFDLIWCHGVIYYISNPFEAMNKICELVTRDGILYLSLQNDTLYAKTINFIRKLLSFIPKFLRFIFSFLISSVFFIILFIFCNERDFSRIRSKVYAQFLPTKYIDIKKTKDFFCERGFKVENVIDSEEDFPSADFGLKLRKIN